MPPLTAVEAVVASGEMSRGKYTLVIRFELETKVCDVRVSTLAKKVQGTTPDM